MSIVLARRLVALSLIPLSVAACGDDSDATGGAGGASASSSTSIASSTTGSPTSTSGTSGDGGSTTSGDGGAGGGEEGGGGSASCTGELPASYDGSSFEDAAAAELALRAQLGALNAPMSAAEADLELTPTAGELVALYEAGDPSLADGFTAYYDGVVREVFEAFEAAAGQEWTPEDPPTGPGGQLGVNLFDAEGRDLRQWVDKGSFNAHFYPLAIEVVDGGLDAAAIDRLLALYGAHPTFPGDSSADTADFPDKLVAQYAERRSPKDPEDASQPLDAEEPGVYFTIKEDFILAQAADAAGCDEERDAAVERILVAWERVMAATVVFYLNDATLKLTIDGATEEDLGGGLHGVGEATSFLHGFKGTPEGRRTITDDEVDEFLALLADPYRFVISPADEVPDLAAARDLIAGIYGFSEAELEAFETAH